MLIEGVRVVAPSRFPADAWSEAEVLGGCVWLWNHHAHYRQGSIESAMDVLLPMIASRHFCFFVRAGQPLGYFNWAYLNEADAHAYTHKAKPYIYFLERRYPDGTEVQLWILSFFFPRGGGQTARRILRRYVLHNERFFFLYHKAKPGIAVTKFSAGIDWQPTSEGSSDPV